MLKKVKIKKIKKISNKSKLYDISVSGNNNFFANGILVHNCSMYKDYLHARSIFGASHPSRGWVKNLHSKISYEIPDGWRLCGENLFAKHSIHYKNLKSYFYLFSIWNDKNECLSWDDMVEWADVLGVSVVPELYRGIWDVDKIKELFEKEHNNDECEGYVVRLVDSFSYGDFQRSLAKYVRANHVQTSCHWRYEKIIKNGIEE